MLLLCSHSVDDVEIDRPRNQDGRCCQVRPLCKLTIAYIPNDEIRRDNEQGVSNAEVSRDPDVDRMATKDRNSEAVVRYC